MDFSTSPWVAGTRALGYYGPVKASQYCVFRDGELRPDWDDLLETLGAEAEKASDGQANFCVGIEMELDPFPDGRARDVVLMRVSATAAKLGSAWE